jgi:geranylgeranyl diphosphate synthase type I
VVTADAPRTADVPQAPAAGDVGGDDLVVLLDVYGHPSGVMPKRDVHHAHTPFHLAFSCYAVDPAGRVLLTRRADGKRTWPSVWTNACCGHPGPGETLRTAVTRRLAQELGLSPARLGLALPDFVYRATMTGTGVVEHELCPVVVALVDGEPVPDPDEVSAVEWTTWDALRRRARDEPDSLSPWSVRQIERLDELGSSPLAWLDEVVPFGAPAIGEVGLDRPMSAEPAPQGPLPLRGRSGPDRPVASPVPVGATVDADAALLSGAAVPSGDGTPLADRRPRWLGPLPVERDALAAVREPVNELLHRFLRQRAAEARTLDPAVGDIADEVGRLVAAGGKRLRPAFVYWGHRATGAAHDDGVLAAAAAVELLHTFALVHDDVMDRSDRRRGHPTAHVALSQRHGDEDLDGDGAWFGLSGAVLAGDLTFVWADQMLDEAPLPAEALVRARRVFTRLRTEVVGGQYLDLRLAHEPDATERAARTVALLKSARYTVTRPLQLGAALAPDGADPATAEALVRYGDAVGLAFQMRDDVLGLFGDPAVTGKSCLDDLREGKRTLLVLRALALAEPDDRRLLAEALGDPALDPERAGRCCAIVAGSGALASIEALLDAQHALALRAIADLYAPARAALEQLADLAIRRWR